jgi:hypothetical protein
LGFEEIDSFQLQWILLLWGPSCLGGDRFLVERYFLFAEVDSLRRGRILSCGSRFLSCGRAKFPWEAKISSVEAELAVGGLNLI